METQRILGYLDDAPDLYFDLLAQVRMDSWSRGRVVLLGDAAACPTPMAGMGTSIAVTGAYTLAGELRAAGGDYASAFKRYEAAMRPFVAEAQKLAESAEWFIPKTRLRLFLSRRLWSWLPQSTLRQLMIDEPNRIADLAPLQLYA